VLHNHLRHARHVYRTRVLPDDLATCPLCKQEPETTVHLLKCPSLRSEVRELVASVGSPAGLPDEFRDLLRAPSEVLALCAGLLTEACRDALGAATHKLIPRVQRLALDGFCSVWEARCRTLDLLRVESADPLTREWLAFLRRTSPDDPGNPSDVDTGAAAPAQ
jgi:hypothetical protein